MIDHRATRPIMILLSDDYAEWEIGFIAGPGRGYYGLSIHFTSPDGKDVTSMGGLRACGLMPFASDGAGVVVVCGGMVWGTPEAPDVCAPLRRAAEAGAVIAAICGGTRALAWAGLLDAVAHTSNGAGELNGEAGYAGAAHHVAAPRAVRDSRIITAPGTAPASFAVEALAAARLAEAALAELRGMLLAGQAS